METNQSQSPKQGEYNQAELTEFFNPLTQEQKSKLQKQRLALDEVQESKISVAEIAKQLINNNSTNQKEFIKLSKALNAEEKIELFKELRRLEVEKAQLAKETINEIAKALIANKLTSEEKNNLISGLRQEQKNMLETELKEQQKTLKPQNGKSKNN